MTAAASRFVCTPGGAIEDGRKRLRRLLALLGVVALGVALLAGWSGRSVPAFLAAGAGGLALLARRMSGDLDPLALELDGERLVIRMRRQVETLPIRGTAVRRLDQDETEHLRRLATVGSVTAGTGGFDSHRLGELDLYASDLSHAVLIDRGETSAVVTPDEPDRFIEALLDAGAEVGRLG